MAVSPRAAELLRVVHDAPGGTRAEAARAIGVGSGPASELVAQLADAGLVAERPAAPTGRGRPTTVLVPHPDGPLVCAVSISHERWWLQAVELGGGVVADVQGEHAGVPAAATLGDIASAVRRLRRRFGSRVRGIAVSAPGPIGGTRLVFAVDPSWRGVDLRRIWPRADVLVAGNDATLAAAAESSRGAAAGARVAIHVRVQAGIGGGIVDDGRVLTGAHGFSGEFGHLPFGDPAVRCACGATGCWGTAVDGGALARLLDRRAPRDPVAYTTRVIAAAATDPAAADAVDRVAGALGRGIAGLVNALDPEVVTIGGSGADLLAAAPQRVDAAYREGLIRYRAGDPPPLLPAALGEAGPLVGAAEQAWRAVWPHL